MTHTGYRHFGSHSNPCLCLKRRFWYQPQISETSSHPLETTSLFSISASLFQFCFIHLFIFSFHIRRRQWYPTPVLFPGESHEQRSLVGCSPWGREVSDATGRLHFHFSLSCIGEGNDNPLQCSYLENPRDGGAWWAAIYGVTQSRTRLN